MRTLLVTLALVGAAAAGDPIYKLKRGMEYVWRMDPTEVPGSGKRLESELRAWVVRSNSDGSVRIVARERFWGARPDRTHWRRFDITRYGIYKPYPAAEPWDPPCSVLPPLPEPDRPEVRIGPNTFRFQQPAPDRIEIAMTSVSLSLRGSRHDTVLQLRDGLPVLVEEAAGDRARTFRLVERIPRDEARMARFARDADAYFDAVRRYEKSLDRAVLETARGKTSGELFRARFDELLKRHADRVRLAKEHREEQARYIGKPSLDWKTSDFAKKKYALLSYRGKVTVLFFWHRNAPHAGEVALQLERVAKHFDRRPVSVLGMNVNRRKVDARAAVKLLDAPFPTLQAESLVSLYGILRYPTIVVLDADAVVRHYHVGFSSSLIDDLTREIDALLRPAK